MSDAVLTGGDAPDDVFVLAGEYVLGALDGQETRAVTLRAARDVSLSDAIVWWENRLHPLTEFVPAVAPPAELWQRIAASTGAAPVVVPLTPRRAASGSRFWQATTAAALALAAAVAGFAVLRPPATTFVAALAPLDSPGPGFVAETSPTGAIRVRALAQVAVATDKDLQLWALPDGAAKPISLGVLPAGGRVVSAAELPRAKTKLLVSLEPKGGSPTGQPTGAVLYGGTLTPLD